MNAKSQNLSILDSLIANYQINSLKSYPKEKYQNSVKKINLTEDGSSYITIKYLPQNLIDTIESTFEDMWNLHPKERHKIIMFGKEVTVPRYSQSYMNTPCDTSIVDHKSYMYSGFNTQSNKQDLPDQFKLYLKHMQSLDSRYNQVITNWYQNNSDMIAMHSDCQLKMIKDAKISIISMYENSNTDNFRIFNLKPKVNVDSKQDIFSIRLDQGMILTMHGQTQDQFTHGIGSEVFDKGRRISVSFRQMT